MKYYKKNDQVYAFESDGSQDDYITEDMQLMQELEVDKHINPEKYMSEEEKLVALTVSLRPLTRKQFKLALLDKGLLDNLETSISTINDITKKKRIEIEYVESTEFVRTSDSIKAMFDLLDKTEEEINSFWQYALTL
jgi:hypothetical protein